MASALSTIGALREQSYLTSKGDTLDAICFRHYGSYSAEILNAVLRRNRWVPGLGVRFPSGKVLVLPVITVASIETRKFKLWEPKTVSPTTAVLPSVDRSKRYQIDQAKLDLAVARYRARKKVPYPEEEPIPYSYTQTTPGPLTDPYGTSLGQDALFVFM